MGTLKLWAIAIDEVRGIFSANPDTASQLRTAATNRFGAAAQPQPGLLRKLGPLFRGGHDPAAPRPGVPGPADVEDLLAGRYVAPHRLDAAWNLLDFWLDTLALGASVWPLSEQALNDFDFDLARAQVPARYGLSDLFKAHLGISMTLCSGLAAGFVRNEHALGMATSWPAGIGELSQDHQELAGGIAGFLAGFGDWTDQARSLGRPDPDLIAIFRDQPEQE